MGRARDMCIYECIYDPVAEGYQTIPGGANAISPKGYTKWKGAMVFSG